MQSQRTPLEVKNYWRVGWVFRREYTNAQAKPKGLHPLNCKVNQVSARRCQASTGMVKLVRMGRGIHTGASNRLVERELWNDALVSGGRLFTNLICVLIKRECETHE